MVNSVVIQGRLTKDIELKQTQGGISYTSFTVAWSEKFKETEVKCFLRCKAWRQTAEFLNNYLHNRGSEMVIEGRLETEEWEKDGEKRSQTILNVTRVHFCGKRTDTPAQAETAAETPSGMVEVNDDEPLPF